MFARTRDLSGLRIEEGTHREIPLTGDPLDGTWTRPDPALRSMLSIQQAGVMLAIIMLWMPMMLIMMIGSDSEFWWLVMMPMIPMLAIMGIMAAVARWSAGRICQRHRFRITDQELVIESGLIGTNRVLIPLVQIQQVNVLETWLGKRYGLKTVTVNTAGFTYVPNAGVAGGTMLMGLRNADDVAEAILSRVKLAKFDSKGA